MEGAGIPIPYGQKARTRCKGVSSSPWSFSAPPPFASSVWHKIQAREHALKPRTRTGVSLLGAQLNSWKQERAAGPEMIRHADAALVCAIGEAVEMVVRPAGSTAAKE